MSENIIKMRKANISSNSCVACGVCAKECPKTAISIYKGSYAVVDIVRCVGCGVCEKNCPAGVIKVEEKSNE